MIMEESSVHEIKTPLRKPASDFDVIIINF